MPGDILLQVNDTNVSRTQSKAVRKLLRFEIILIKDNIHYFLLKSQIEVYHYQ